MKRAFISLIATSILATACQDGTPQAVDPNPFSDISADQLETVMTERAAHYDVPSLSVTILHEDQEQSIYLGEAGPTSLMQAASLSKAVAAAGILILMEREDIDLDQDIRDYFTSINIRDIAGGDQPLTVRELLSHTAGATQGGYPGYRRGSHLPTSSEIILDPPNRFVSAVELTKPKGEFSYSGGGYQLAQLLAEDISGEPFDQLMKTLLFDPLEMTASRFTHPIEDTDIAPFTITSATSPRRIREGLFRPLRDSWNNYPERAAAGLWTTSHDYARFIRAVITAAEDRPSPLSPSVAKAMLTPVTKTNFGDETDYYGLGLVLQSEETESVYALHHSGLNAGYRAYVAADLRTQRVIVSLANTPGGAALNREIIDGLLLQSEP